MTTPDPTPTVYDPADAIADEPIAVNFGNKVRKTERVRRLLFADGHTMLICAQCLRTEDDTPSGQAVLLIHTGKTHNPAKAAMKSEVDSMMDLTLGDLVKMAQARDKIRAALEAMTEDRNEWKRRAQQYRNTLSRLRRDLTDKDD